MDGPGLDLGTLQASAEWGMRMCMGSGYYPQTGLGAWNWELCQFVNDGYPASHGDQATWVHRDLYVHVKLISMPYLIPTLKDLLTLSWHVCLYV